MEITLSENLSYCFGVKRTLTLVDKLLEENADKSYYMLGEIVHNEHVINNLKSKGLHIVYDLDQIEKEGVVIIQSHGAPRKTYTTLKNKMIHYIDATCPMVGVIHKKIKALEKNGYFPVIIGKKGHDEVKGIAGQVKSSLIIGHPEEIDPEDFIHHKKIGVVVQSTFIHADAMAIMDRLKSLNSEIKLENTICRPTTERQAEIHDEAALFDCILIVGSQTSANTKHLFTLASERSDCVYLIDNPETLTDLYIPKNAKVFIASGASTPLSLIEQTISILLHRQDNDPVKEGAHA